VIIIKKYFEYLGIIGICLLSFYYTEKVALYVRNKNPLMKTISSLSVDKNVHSIEAEIVDGKYIIPGLSGKEIDLGESYARMQENNTYDEDRLVFNEIKPEVSLEENKDKIIIKGNKEKKSVSLVFESVNDLTRYLHQNNYKINVLINKEEYDFNYELINNSNVEQTFTSIEKALNKVKKNKNLCMIKNEQIPDYCKGKYLFLPSITISHSNISSEKNNIESGDIVLIKDSISLAELNVILNQIKYQDLSIVPLSELILEN